MDMRYLAMRKTLIQAEAGVLKQEKHDVYYYSALVPEADYMKAKTLSFVERIYGGNAKGLLSALISYEEVSTEDLEELRSFWVKERKSGE